MKKLLLLLSFITSCGVAVLQAQTRFYDENGFYQGRADYSNGQYRFYDSNGFYQGRAQSNGFGGGFRYYDGNGFYQGRSGGW